MHEGRRRGAGLGIVLSIVVAVGLGLILLRGGVEEPAPAAISVVPKSASGALPANDATRAPESPAIAPDELAPASSTEVLPPHAFRATITGIVVAASGEPVAGAVVVCVPNDATLHDLDPAAESLLPTLFHEQHERLPAERLGWPTTQTAPDGTFSLSTVLLPDASRWPAVLARYAQLVVHHPEHGLFIRPCRDVVRNGTLDTGEIRLPPGSHVTGLAVDATGRPVRGALVAALGWMADESIQATIDRRLADALALLLDVRTEADGRFDLASLPAGKGHVRVMAADTCDVDVALVLPAGGGVDVGVLELGEGSSLAGTVRSLDGQPLQGAHVIAVAGRPETLVVDAESVHTALLEVGDLRTLASTISAADGSFTVSCAPAQPATLIAAHEGYEPAAQMLVPVGAVGRELRLAPLRALALRIEDGRTHAALPAADVTVWRLVKAPLGSTAEPDVLRVSHASSGGAPAGATHVVSDVCSVDLGVHVRVAGRGAETFIVHPSEVAVDAAAVLELQPGGGIRGTVTDSQEQPVVGAEISARLVPPEIIESSWEEVVKGLRGREESPEYTAHRMAQTTQARMQESPSTRTAADGGYALDALVAGTWQLECRAEDRAVVRPEPVAVTAGATARVDIVVELSGSIAGEVLDATGQPAGAQRVAILDKDSKGSASYLPVGTIDMSTDAHGAFAFGGVTPGPYRVVVLGGGVEQPVDVRPGEESRVVLQLPPDAVLDGLVLAAGQPVNGASVSLLGRNSLFKLSAAATTDASGSFSMHGRWSGTYTFQASGPTGTPGPGVPVALLPGRRAFVTLTLGTASLRCRAVDRDSAAPVPFARLRLFNDAGPVGPEQVADAGGVAVFRDLQPDSYGVRGVGGGSPHPPHGHLILEPESWGGTHLLATSDPITITAPDGETSVELRLPRGASLEGRIVSASGEPAPPHVQVHLTRIQDQDGSTRELFTDDGRFTFSPLCGGPHLLTVTIVPGVVVEKEVQLTEGSASEIAVTYP